MHDSVMFINETNMCIVLWSRHCLSTSTEEFWNEVEKQLTGNLFMLKERSLE